MPLTWFLAPPIRCFTLSSGIVACEKIKGVHNLSLTSQFACSVRRLSRISITLVNVFDFFLFLSFLGSY